MEEILTLEQAAVILKIPAATIHRLANLGLLPGLRGNREWKFYREVVEGMSRNPRLIRHMEERAWEKSSV